MAMPCVSDLGGAPHPSLKNKDDRYSAQVSVIMAIPEGKMKKSTVNMYTNAAPSP